MTYNQLMWLGFGSMSFSALILLLQWDWLCIMAGVMAYVCLTEVDTDETN